MGCVFSLESVVLVLDGILGHQFDKRHFCYMLFRVSSTFKIAYKKSAKQDFSSLFMKSILWNVKMRVENSSLKRLEFMPRNLD